MEQKEITPFGIKLKWKISTDEIKELNSFSYSYFKFEFILKDKDILLDFADLVSVPIQEIDIIEFFNFFCKNRIYLNVKFRPILKMGLKSNITMFFVFIEMKQSYKEFLKNSYKKKHVFSFKSRKDKFDTSFHLINTWKNTNVGLRINSKIWWKPKKIMHDESKYFGYSCGWLFIEFFYITYIKTKEN